MTAEEIKALLKLEPHPVEGGWYRRTYTSECNVELERACAPAARPFTT
jgi:predicted cupin superfamily sugar epimerase